MIIIKVYHQQYCFKTIKTHSEDRADEIAASYIEAGFTVKQEIV